MWTPALGVTAVMLPELDFDEQLALYGELGLTHYCFRPRVIADKDKGQPWSNWGNHKFDLTPEMLVKDAARIRRRLAEAGVSAFGTVPGASAADADDVLKVHLEGAAAVGAGRVRVNPQSYPGGVFDYEAFVAQAVERYGRIVAMARPMGLKVVIETHARSLAAGPALAWNICRHFDPADLGVIFDLPNFVREGNHPANLATAVVGRWIDHCHVGAARRVTRSYDALGFRHVGDQFCPLSEGDLHVPTYLAALRDAGLTPPLLIEDYTEAVPGAMRLRRNVEELRRALDAL